MPLNFLLAWPDQCEPQTEMDVIRIVTDHVHRGSQQLGRRATAWVAMLCNFLGWLAL
jgi:hypothetical protein